VSNPYHQPNPYQDQQPHDPYTGGTPGYQYPASSYGGYGGYGGGPTGEPNNLAMVAVVLGFISTVGSFLCYSGFIAPVGIGFGVAALKKSQTTGTGRNAAIGGIVMSTLGLLVTVVLIIGFVHLARNTP
jgi:hypothetical protein